MKYCYQRVPIVAMLVMLAMSITWLQGCATYDADKSYLATRTQFNDEVARYLEYFDASTDAEKAIYREDVDPLILKASQALDVWGAARILRNGDGTELSGYLDAKNAMIDAMVKAYAKEE